MKKYIVLNSLKIISSEQSMPSKKGYNFTFPNKLKFIERNSVIEVINYNIKVTTGLEALIAWKGSRYQVGLSKEDIEEYDGFERKPQVCLPNLIPGNLCKIKSGLNTTHGYFLDYIHFYKNEVKDDKKIIKKDDNFIFLNKKFWRDYKYKGYEFQIIFEDEIGWIGKGLWLELENVDSSKYLIED